MFKELLHLILRISQDLLLLLTGYIQFQVDQQIYGDHKHTTIQQMGHSLLSLILTHSIVLHKDQQDHQVIKENQVQLGLKVKQDRRVFQVSKVFKDLKEIKVREDLKEIKEQEDLKDHKAIKDLKEIQVMLVWQDLKVFKEFQDQEVVAF